MSATMASDRTNPYRWTVEHEHDILGEDEDYLPEDKFYFLCTIRKVYLNYYITDDGRYWRFYTRKYFNYHKVETICMDVDEKDSIWLSRINQTLASLHVPLPYQFDIMRDIKVKASSILQENERPKRIPIVVDIIHRIPQIIPNYYQDYHEEADMDEIDLIQEAVGDEIEWIDEAEIELIEEAVDDEIELIEEAVDEYELSLQEAVEIVPIPASRYAVEALEKVNVEAVNVGDNCSICFEELFCEGVVEVTSMPCKHLFHEGCIAQWLDKNHVCPLCRFEMPVDTNYLGL